jgi:hypothetical protein
MPLVPIIPISGENRCIDPPRATGGAAEQFGDELERRKSFGERVTVATVRAEDRVIDAQVRAHAGGDGFLADVSMTGAVHQAARMEAGELLLGCADELHRTVEVGLVGGHASGLCQ